MKINSDENALALGVRYHTKLGGWKTSVFSAEEIYYPNHGFKILDTIASKNDGWELAIAKNSKENLAQGIIINIISDDVFELGYVGTIKNLPFSGNPNETLYLSPIEYGHLTKDKPEGVDQFIQPLIKIIDENTVELLNGDNFSITKAGKEYIDSITTLAIVDAFEREIVQNSTSDISLIIRENSPKTVEIIKRMLK